MFAYCLSNPVCYFDSSGTDAAAVGYWTTTMWWLCSVDGVLPIGDLAYLGGFVVLTLFTWASYKNEVQLPADSVLRASAKEETPQQISSTDSRRQKPTNLPSWKKLTVDLEHVISNHTPGGPGNNGRKTIFYGLTPAQILKAIEEAYNYCKKIGSNPDGYHIQLQGYSSSFDLLIEMWLNLKDLIIETAYPKN